MSDPTDLFLPPHLPYPIKLVAHAAQPGDTVQRGTRLLSYSFNYTNAENEQELRFGTWDSSIEGTLDRWAFAVGETVSQRRALTTPAVKITEPCKHGMQLSGLCCLCGKDMTDFDYTGFSDASRASIQMTHAANGPTVSLEEAQRIERETADHLRKSRKLSLIVDLDQTIVHATVDPTVGEWIAEGEAWEQREAKRKAAAEAGQEVPPAEDDEVNPNWEALKDVKKFKLGPEALGNPRLRGPKGKSKDKSVEMEGCMYYIKPRPGWKEFLETMSEKYEMHVYTMGTRAYAEEVCAAIDPDDKIFGGRLLSRDESGSITQKSLQRLFPCDQSMVVIIDDRADVWEWSPNLVKVVPFEFFVGIGDINSAFLPKQKPLAPSIPASPPIPGIPTPPPPPPTTAAEIPEPTDPISPFDEVLPVTDDTPQELAEIAKSEILAANAVALDAQLEERPLAKMQEKVQEEEDAKEDAAEAESRASSVNGDVEPTANGNGVEVPRTPTPTREKHHRKALLKNTDTELVRVQRLLEEVHRQYYTAFDERPAEEKPKPKKSSRRREPDPLAYDVRLIISMLRQETLAGVHIVFSSVIPLDVRPDSSETWRVAKLFGAQCYTELSSRITHVVAAKRGTVKVDAARRQRGIKIVWVSWFTDCINQWRRQDETPYLIDPETTAHTVGPASPPSDVHQISSDPEPDADDWDYDNREGGPEGGLGLDEVDWSAANDEVEAAMNESDDDDDDDGGGADDASEKSAMRSDDEWTDESNSVVSSASSTPSRRKRKRLRSVTPSDAGSAGDKDELRSPLAKRKKLTQERSGTRLKEAITAEELEEQEKRKEEKEEEEEEDKTPAPTPAAATAAATTTAEAEEAADDADMDDDDYSSSGSSSSEGEGEGDDDDDFLARELGEDWG